jgi:hypothetical protein
MTWIKRCKAGPYDDGMRKDEVALVLLADGPHQVLPGTYRLEEGEAGGTTLGIPGPTITFIEGVTVNEKRATRRVVVPVTSVLAVMSAASVVSGFDSTQ